jgi:hypothetical protein
MCRGCAKHEIGERAVHVIASLLDPLHRGAHYRFGPVITTIIEVINDFFDSYSNTLQAHSALH